MSSVPSATAVSYSPPVQPSDEARAKREEARLAREQEAQQEKDARPPAKTQGTGTVVDIRT